MRKLLVLLALLFVSCESHAQVPCGQSQGSNWYSFATDSSPSTQVWYWQGGAFVNPTTDVGYLAWVAAGCVAPTYPTAAQMYAAVDILNQTLIATGAYSGANPVVSSVDVTLTNPMKSTQAVVMNAAGKYLILPKMNVTGSLPTGLLVSIANTGSNAFGLKAASGSILQPNIDPGETLYLKLYTNTTSDGSLSQDFVSQYGSALLIGRGGTGANTAAGARSNIGADNATNLTSGTVASARGGAGTVNGALKGNGSGVVSQAACADLTNGGNGGCALTYAEGTWTPTFLGSTTAGTVTYTNQQGSYERIGRQWTLRFQLTTNTVGGGIAGNALIGGLPFTQFNSAGEYGHCFITFTTAVTLTAGYTVLSGIIINNDNKISLYQIGSGVSSINLPVGGYAAGGYIDGYCNGRT